MDNKKNLNQNMTEEMNDESVENAFNKLLEQAENEEEYLKSLPSNNGINESESEYDSIGEAEYVTAAIDPVTGEKKFIAPLVEKEHVDDFDKLLDMSEEDIKKEIEISDESLKSSLDSICPNMNIEDILTFKKVLDRYRKGEKFSYFNALPQCMKDMINNFLGAQPESISIIREARKAMVIEIFEDVIKDNYIDKAFTDLQDSINKEKKKMFGEMQEGFSEYNVENREVMENKLPLIAEQYRKDGNLEKAELLERVTASFKESYTYDKLYGLYNDGKLKIKRIEIDKFKRTCDGFNSKYKDSSMIINDVSTIVPVIDRHTDSQYSENCIREFVTAFIKYTMNMKPDNIDEHVYMYFFIKHILNLDYYDHNNKTESLFYDNLIKMIQIFLNTIQIKKGY